MDGRYITIVEDVFAEMEKSVREKGELTTDPVRACAILFNEVSEATAEALKITNPTGTASHRRAKGTREAMYTELVQVASLAFMMMRNLRRDS